MADSIAVNPPSSLIAKVEKLLCAPAPFQSPCKIIIKLYSGMIDKKNTHYVGIKFVHVLLYDIFVPTLFWDDITIIWDENIVYFFN